MQDPCVNKIIRVSNNNSKVPFSRIVTRNVSEHNVSLSNNVNKNRKKVTFNKDIISVPDNVPLKQVRFQNDSCSIKKPCVNKSLLIPKPILKNNSLPKLSQRRRSVDAFVAVYTLNKGNYLCCTSSDDWNQWLEKVNRFYRSPRVSPIMIQKPMDNRPHLKVKVGDRIVTTLVDTDATNSILGSEGWKLLADELRHGMAPSSVLQINVADGSSDPVAGEVSLTVELNSIK